MSNVSKLFKFNSIVKSISTSSNLIACYSCCGGFELAFVIYTSSAVLKDAIFDFVGVDVIKHRIYVVLHRIEHEIMNSLTAKNIVTAKREIFYSFFKLIFQKITQNRVYKV